MFSYLYEGFHSALSSSTENFNNGNVPLTRGNVDPMALFLTMLVYLLVLLWAGQTLWNKILVKVFPMVNKVNSMFDFLGLILLFQLIFPH
mgnify:CR=1 FL=1